MRTLAQCAMCRENYTLAELENRPLADFSEKMVWRCVCGWVVSASHADYDRAMDDWMPEGRQVASRPAPALPKLLGAQEALLRYHGVGGSHE